MAKPLPDYALVDSLLSYDPQTGEVRWKVDRLPVKAGSIAGFIDGDGYRSIQISRQNLREHRIAWLLTTGEWPQGSIDHRDRNASNNRWDNLRLANQHQQGANRSVGGSSRYKGVSLMKRWGTWKAYIRVAGRQMHLGVFQTEAEAAAAYDRAASQHFGEYASLNFAAA